MQHERVCQVVDILTGAGEMQVFFLRSKSCVGIKTLLQEVLNGLDIVIGRLLDFFDSLSILE